MNNRRIDRIEWMLAGLFLLILAMTVVINFHVARHVLDDDAVAELMLADALRREKSL